MVQISNINTVGESLYLGNLLKNKFIEIMLPYNITLS